MKNRKTGPGTILVLTAVLLVTSCTPDSGPSPEATLTMDWGEIRSAARGTEVNWAMWGGDERINAWVDGVVAPLLQEDYGVRLNRIPMDAQVFVSKLSNEKRAGSDRGTLDLLWINGENFRRAREEGLLLGPVSPLLPNMSLVNPDDVAYDFGTPVEGLEVPFGRAQFVFEYDSARVPNPPENFDQLREWIIANPGRFTYPVASDFTGSAFIRQLFYHVAGGHRQFLPGFDQALFEPAAEATWQWLNDIEPYLWQQGRSYPSAKAQLDTLFERGEVDFNMSYSQGGAQGLIAAGRYPETVRTFVMEGNSLGNIHFTAIPFNAPNAPAALVLANLLLDPRVQASKNDPANWGDFTVLDPARLSSEQNALFDSLDLGPATLPLEQLSAHMVSEVSAAYVDALEEGWEAWVPGQD